MRYLTIKEVRSVATYKGVDSEMKITDKIIEFDGAKKHGDVTDHLHNTGELFISGSVNVDVIKNSFKVPGEVIQKLVHADLNGGFVQTEDDNYTWFRFNTELYFNCTVSDLGIVETAISTTKESEDFGPITGISVPVAVHRYLLTEYRV